MYHLLFIIIFLPIVSPLLEIMTFSKLIYIPGGYYSLANFTSNVQDISELFDTRIDINITQTATNFQCNSIFDLFQFPLNIYPQVEPCYSQAVSQVNNLYQNYQPCQGQCQHDVIQSRGLSNLSKILLNSQQNEIVTAKSIIIDNTFVPCTGGVYQSEVYLYESVNFLIQSNVDYFLLLKIIGIILLQVLIFLLAYILIMINKLQNKKKILKNIRQYQEAQEVLKQFQQA